MTSNPFVNRTLATFRSAELGFFGVRVITCTHTPRRNGQFVSAGDLDFTVTFWRPLRTSWLIVGMWKISAASAAAFPRDIRGLKTPPGRLFQSPPGAGSADTREINLRCKGIFFAFTIFLRWLRQLPLVEAAGC